MKANAIQYSKEGAISVVEVTLDDPSPGEVQLRGAACGICAWDIATCKQGAAMAFPAPPGHEGVAYVQKVGAGVRGLKEGDRVLGGGFATVSNCDATCVRKIPGNLPDEQWLGEPVSCVVTGMDTAKLRAGDWVALLGCGFMGLIFAQLLTRSPLSRVLALDIDAHKLNLAREFGVVETQQLTKGDNTEILQELKKEGFEVVIDTTGTQEGLESATKLVARGGQINLFGWIKGRQAMFDPTAWHLQGYTIVNSSPSAAVRDPFPAAIRLIGDGLVNLSPLITHLAGIHEYADLMKKIIAGDPGYIKGVIKLDTVRP